MVNRYTRTAFGVFLVALLLAPATPAQEDQWRKLQTLTGTLMAERRFKDALRTGEMAIVVAENTWGAESVRVADGLNNLAMVYFYSDQPDHAEGAYRRAIEIYDKTYGPHHFKSLNPHKSLARLCEARGKLDFARRHYADAVKISEKRFGPTHPATEEVLYNLGTLLMAQGQMAAADGVLRRILAIRVKRYGTRHMRVAEILKSLIQVYKSQGIYDGLDAIAQRVMDIETASMPLDDPRLISTHTDLGDIYRLTDRPALAEPYYRRALVLREQHEGPDYYPEQESHTNFARVTVSGQSADSILITWNRPIGKDHVTRITTLNQLAKVLSQQNRPAEATPFYDRSLGIAERAYGPDHPATAMAVKNLAETYYALGDMDAARPHYERIARLCDRARQKDDDALEQYLDVLSQIYFMEQRYTEAADTYYRILELQRKTLGADHPALASTLNNLAEVERLQEHHNEAEVRYLEALVIYDKAGDSAPNTIGLRAVLGNLARLYEQTDRKKQARPYRERLETLASQASSPATLVLP